MYFNNYAQQIIRVNGEGGARALQMMPNSSALLLDENQPLVWHVQTDGAGYKTITPYKIERYQPAPAPDYQELINRIQKLEERINESDYKRNADAEPRHAGTSKPFHADDDKQPDVQKFYAGEPR